MKLYQDADYIDCRIAAYPFNNNSNNVQIVNFVMIDLDLSNFNYSLQGLNKSVSKILRNIRKVSNNIFEPSVIWSGNGYHILIPIEPLEHNLEDMQEFSTTLINCKEPSKE